MFNVGNITKQRKKDTTFGENHTDEVFSVFTFLAYSSFWHESEQL